MEARRLNGNTTLQLSGHSRAGKRGCRLMPATVIVNCLVKAVNQQLWTSFARHVVYSCRTQLCSHPWQPRVILIWAFHHHGLKLCEWRVFTHHQVGVEEPPENRGSEAPDSPPPIVPPSVPCPGALLPAVVQVCWDHNTFFKNQSDFSLHFSLCLTCLSLTVMFVAALSAGVALFMIQSFFTFCLLISPALHSFHINLGDQR